MPEPQEKPTEPTEKPPEPKVDPYESIDEQYRDVVKDNDELLNGLDPLDRLRVTEVARRAEQLVLSGAITRDQLMGTAPVTPKEPPRSEPKPEPKKTGKSDETVERIERLENLILQDREERKKKEEAETRASLERRFDGAISEGLDQFDISDDELRQALTDEFTGKFMRMKNKPGAEGYGRAVSKFLKGKIDESAKQASEERGTYILSKLAQQQATNTETRGAGAAPSKGVPRLAPADAKDPRKSAEFVKEKLGIA